MMYFQCSPGGIVTGSIRVPGDKSISHRSIIFSSIANGTSHITGFLEGEDSLNTLKAFQAMGVVIDQNSDQIVVHGVGLNGLKAPAKKLDMGNSGTAMRLLLGLLAGQEFDSELIGDESLSTRPMNRVINPLEAMGAKIHSQQGGTAPLFINGGSHLKAIEYDLPMASAQVKSCILLAGLYAEGKTVVREPAPTRDHSERMLRGFGCDVASNGNEIRMSGLQSLKATDIDVPADISSAAFFMVAASIAKGSEIKLEHVGVNPTRTGVIDILRLMGADISLHNEKYMGGEPVADITVRSAQLKGIVIPEELVPLAIDEFPVLFVAASCADGETILSGAEELRVKESDRIQVMADGLNILGIDAQPTVDGIRIQGGQLGGGEVESHGDHRIAMAFSVASLCARAKIKINNCANVNTSFPGFVTLASNTGLRITSHDTE
ncbi:MAG: 3-phosphoshikimate 1-carboxyvinyltransferase [Gammaproteobacteria bacterium]|nr:3-phosphoshikimate 1-carboxyvinyltransferase [Gammaproteobacteria bacterium]